MTTTEILALLLALSVALNLGLSTAALARSTGNSPPAAILAGAGVALTALGVYFTAVSAYR